MFFKKGGCVLYGDIDRGYKVKKTYRKLAFNVWFKDAEKNLDVSYPTFTSGDYSTMYIYIYTFFAF